MRANAVVLSRVFYDGVQRRQRAPVAALSEPENRRAASAETAVPRDVNECGDAGAIAEKTQRRHRRRRQTLLAGPGVVLIDVLADRAGPATASKGNQRRNYSGVAEQADPLNRLASGFLDARVISRQ